MENEPTDTTQNKISSLKKQLSGIDIGKILQVENLFSNAPFFLFLGLVAILYIGNTHMMEKTVRRIDRLNDELKEIRWEYMSGKADLMYKSKQSEVANAVESMGLKEIVDPPKKVIIKNE